ncbi:glycosyltransferase [Acetobacteraceae bacterium]|nr:glycosyltransferase [Candidatus Parcubacteria bacterium]
MNVLMITGDRNTMIYHSEAYKRIELQRSQVERLEVVFWGRGSIWPKIPAGPFGVVTVQDPLLRGMYAWRTARKIGARFNVQVHMDLQSLPLWKHILAQIVLRHADSVRAVSEKIKKQVENIGIKAPVSVLPIYIDIARFQNLERKPHEGKIILWVGRFEEEKDPLLALSVFKKVRASVDARLVMLGKGKLGDALRKEAGDLPVEFPGWQDPATYYAAADVVLCTSRHESWGASIIEALASGVPVVSSDVGVAKEAGAIVSARSDLAETTMDVLRLGSRGELKIPLLSKEEWIKRWKETL